MFTALSIAPEPFAVEDGEMTKKAAAPPRVRRTAERAREEILDAAERRLTESGPGSIRLQDVAADVGVSHPAVLHHFGSREGLVAAVVERAIRKLEAELVSALARMGEATEASGGKTAGDRAPHDTRFEQAHEALFELVHEALFTRGHARLIGWLLLSGYDPFASPALRDGWAMITEATHALRLTRANAANAAGGRKKKPSLEDTKFAVVLSALALFGQAIAGPSASAAAGLESDPRTEKRFRAWVARLLQRHFEADA